MKARLNIPDLIKSASDRIYNSLNRFFQGKTEIPGTNKDIKSNDVNANLIYMEWDLNQGIEDIMINDISFFFSKLLSNKFINTLSIIRKRILLSLEFDVLDNGETQADETYIVPASLKPKIILLTNPTIQPPVSKVYTRFRQKASHLSRKLRIREAIPVSLSFGVFTMFTRTCGFHNLKLTSKQSVVNLSFIPFFHKRN